MVPTQTETPLSGELLRKLADVKGPCITIVLPLTNPQKFDAEKRKAISAVENAAGVNGKELKELLEPIANARAQEGGSLVLFRAPDFFEQFSTVRELPAMAVAGEQFQIRPLLPLFEEDRTFYILALSQGHSRLLRCTDSTSEEVPFPEGTPTNLGDFKQTSKPDHVLDSRSAAGPSVGSMKGVLSGTSSDADATDQYLLHFFALLDRTVNEMLKGSEAPLVVVSVKHELDEFRHVSTYPHLVDPGVHGSPDGLKGGEMHKRALELLNSRPPEKVSKLVAQFDKLVGTGHASVRMQEIVRAAHEGRVSHLWLQANAEYTGSFNEFKQSVKRHADDLDHPVDLLNLAVLETIRNSGSVTVLPSDQMPNGVPAAAIFRYPAPDTQSTGNPPARFEA